MTTFKTSDLSASLRLVSKVLEKNTVQPIYEYILLNEGQVIGSDGEVGLIVDVPDLQDLSPVCVDKKIVTMLNKISDEEVDFELDANVLHLKAGKHHSKYACRPAEEYPFKEVEETEGMAQIRKPDNEKFGEVLSAALQTAGDAKQGIDVIGVYGLSRIVSTTESALTVCNLPCEAEPWDEEREFIIPSKFWKLFTEMGFPPEGLRFGRNYVLAKKKGMVLCSTYRQTSLPPWKELVPEEGSRKESLNLEELGNALNRITLLSSNEDCMLDSSEEGKAKIIYAEMVNSVVEEVDFVGGKMPEGKVVFTPVDLTNALKFCNMMLFDDWCETVANFNSSKKEGMPGTMILSNGDESIMRILGVTKA